MSASQSERPKALVLGGGFAGVQAAIELAKSRRFLVTLISDRSYMHLFPTSIWTPIRTVKVEKTQIPLDDVAAAFGFSVLIASVEGISTETNTVTAGGETLNYDYLVIAMGPGKSTPPGLERSPALCNGPQAALDIRANLDDLLAAGQGRIAVGFGGNPKDSSAVRGGPAFEFLFNVDLMLRKAKVRDQYELTFFAPMAKPGARMGERAANMMPGQLAARNIAMRTGVPIAGFDEQGVSFKDGSRLDAEFIMFIPGSMGHPLLRDSGLPLNDAGFVITDDHNLVQGHTNVYAVGDVAALEGPDWRAKQGHIAEIQGRNAAFNIIAADSGRPERRGYVHHVNILCLMDIGNGAVMVYRDSKRQIALPMPIVGHWFKQLWGMYSKAAKRGKMFRIPGL